MLQKLNLKEKTIHVKMYFSGTAQTCQLPSNGKCCKMLIKESHIEDGQDEGDYTQ